MQPEYHIGQRVRVTNHRLADDGKLGEIVRVDSPGGYHVRLEDDQPVRGSSSFSRWS